MKTHKHTKECYEAYENWIKTYYKRNQAYAKWNKTHDKLIEAHNKWKEEKIKCECEGK